MSESEHMTKDELQEIEARFVGWGLCPACKGRGWISNYALQRDAGGEPQRLWWGSADCPECRRRQGAAALLAEVRRLQEKQ